ncbi:MAG: PilZ domain-containing protein [Oligoflexia bacterium]|nr:PilZ domain-containing protein [Oligoflexia bacterium]
MKTRPWPLVLLALFQVLSPLGTLLFNSWALGVKPAYLWTWLLQRPGLEVFETLALMPLAGLALYQMKSWGYAFFLAALSWGFFRNLSRWDYASQYFSLGLATALYAVQAALALYFLIPSVRKVYLNPRLRWWEAKRRFVFEHPLEIRHENQPLTGRSENISEGGIFATLPARLEKGTRVSVRFSLLGVAFEREAKVVYSVGREGGNFAHGLRFENGPGTARRFRRFIRGLELIGVPCRDQAERLPWHVSIGRWALGVARTGKGLVPETPSSRKS